MKKIVLNNFPKNLYLNTDGSPKPLRWKVRAHNPGQCWICDQDAPLFDISSSLDPTCYINAVCEACFQPFYKALTEAIHSVGPRIVKRIEPVKHFEPEVTQASRGQVKQRHAKTPNRAFVVYDEPMISRGFSDFRAYSYWLEDIEKKSAIIEANSHRRLVGSVM